MLVLLLLLLLLAQLGTDCDSFKWRFGLLHFLFRLGEGLVSVWWGVVGGAQGGGTVTGVRGAKELGGLVVREDSEVDSCD